MEKKYFIEKVFEALDKYNQDVKVYQQYKHEEWVDDMSKKYNVPKSVFEVGNVFSELH